MSVHWWFSKTTPSGEDQNSLCKKINVNWIVIATCDFRALEEGYTEQETLRKLCKYRFTPGFKGARHQEKFFLATE